MLAAFGYRVRVAPPDTSSRQAGAASALTPSAPCAQPERVVFGPRAPPLRSGRSLHRPRAGHADLSTTQSYPVDYTQAPNSAPNSTGLDPVWWTRGSGGLCRLTESIRDSDAADHTEGPSVG